MRRTTCCDVIEVLFIIIFIAQVRAVPIPSSLDGRQGEGDRSQMVETITRINNEAGQTLTETCYYLPNDPDNQTCSTAVTWTTNEDKDDSGQTTTIWPGEKASPTDPVQNEANPTSVVFPSVLFPSHATGTRDTDIKTASAIGSISASSTISATQHTSALLVAESTAENAVPTNQVAESSDNHSVDVTTMEEEVDSSFPGQHLSVLPIGLAIYCSVMGLGLLVILYMFLVRMKYRRDYRRRKTRIGLGMGVPMGIGLGFDSRFAASEVRST